MTASALEQASLLQEILAGLSAAPKRLPGKLLWDEAGSILFDRICSHLDYYPVQREMALLPVAARALAQRIGPGATIVEFGSGASRKIRALLDAFEQPARYVAIDISGEYLSTAIDRLRLHYPGIEMIPVCADYTQAIRLPLELEGPVLGFFPGTSIGNFPPQMAQSFLMRAREMLGPNRLLVGVDPTQNTDRLRNVYGDCGGLMPAFHLNMLERLRRDFDARIDPQAFRHEARVHVEPLRVEAHLVATHTDTWRLHGRTFAFPAGESVCTDVSYKYAPETFRALAERAGWDPEQFWLDPQGSFSLHLLKG